MDRNWTRTDRNYVKKKKVALDWPYVWQTTENFEQTGSRVETSWTKKAWETKRGDRLNEGAQQQENHGQKRRRSLKTDLGGKLLLKPYAPDGSTANKLSRTPRKSAVLLAKNMGCKSDNPSEVLAFLQAAPVQDILNNSLSIFREVEGCWPGEETILSFSFAPCVEPTETKDAFLTRRPADIISAGDFHDVPYVTGICEREGVFLLTSADQVPTLTSDFLEKLLPKELNLQKNSPKVSEAANKVRDFYFPNGSSHDGYLRALSAIYIGYGVGKAVAAIAKKNAKPAYLYRFKGSRPSSTIKLFFNINHPATSHGEDFDFLFPRTMPPEPPIVEGTDEDATRNNICKLWTDFVKTGDFGGVWPEASETQSSYLDISTTLQTKTNFLDGEIELWDQVYEILTN